MPPTQPPAPHPVPPTGRFAWVARLAMAVLVVAWAVILGIGSQVIGWVIALDNCPNVGPGIYLGDPEPVCEHGYRMRALRWAALIFVVPVAAVGFATLAHSRAARGREGSHHR